MDSFLKFLKWILVLVFSFLALFFLLSQLNLPGSYKVFLVQSGSMSPTLNTGDVVIIKPVSQYRSDDIITFNSNQNFTITHRIIKDIDGSFTTKGDANPVSDQNTISTSDILGKVFFTIPKIGYFIMFVKSLPGLITLIIIPSTMIIYQEFLEIKKNFKKSISN
ncbi:MAG: signal peptidase I [Candidatus Shapirobacteria bacterium]|nr:signal peptidase I [Candidatus Shapirobacteria bacterium]